jgi:hypothetical protein
LTPLFSASLALKDFLTGFIPHHHILSPNQKTISPTNFISTLSSEFTSRLSTPHIPSSFIACTPYRQLSQAFYFFQSHQIQTELISLSVENNQACHIFDSTIPQLDLLVTASSASAFAIPSWNVVIPYSNHLKIDPSVITFITWLENRADSSSSTSFSTSLNQEPHILHFEASPDDLYFSLLLSSSKLSVAAFSPKELIKNWIASLSSNSENRPCHLCSPNENQKTTRKLSENIYPTRVASSVDSFLKKHSSSSHFESSVSAPETHWDRWSRSWTTSAAAAAGASSAATHQNLLNHCQFSPNQFKFRSHEILFTPNSQQHSSSSAYSCLSALVSLMIHSPEIAKIAISFKLRTLNDYSRGIIQTGTPGEELYSDMKLTGSGVIIGQADTGIDELSCYFIDPLLGQVPRSSLEAPVTNHSYRKVIQYINYTSSGDVPSGHGTHTAGILSGNCFIAASPSSAGTANGTVTDKNRGVTDRSRSIRLESEPDKSSYNGIAMNSKIAFFDLGASVEDGSYLETPTDVSEMIKPAYAAGATIHSDSWGGGYWYDSYCYEVDRYLYQHKDMVILFAAGNSGGYGTHTVLSPSIAKNAIAVGATGTGHTNGQKINIPAFFSSAGPTPDGRYVCDSPSKTF